MPPASGEAGGVERLQTARNFGGAIVLGLHAYAKLKEVYGENMAMTLSSLARTKLILGTADRETATWCSDFIGHRQVRDMEEAYTYGYNNARDAVSLTPRKHIEPLLLPDQLMNLPRLSGYIKFPDGFPAAPVKLKPTSRPKVAETFIGRAKDRPSAGTPPAQLPASQSPPEPSPLKAEHPSANDDGAGKPVVPKQGVLALEPHNPEGSVEPRMQAGQDVRSGLRDGAGRPSEAELKDGKAKDIGAHPKRIAPVVPLSKDAVLRADAAATENDPARDAREPGRLDAPRVGVPESRPHASDNAADRQNDAEARKLMLEDGMPEPDTPTREGPDLGDLEL